MNEKNNQQQNETPLHLTPDSTLQSASEKAHDQSVDPRKDDRLSVSKDDLRENDADRFAGSDRAGTSERKDNTTDQEG